jgi:hypothetical protein
VKRCYIEMAGDIPTGVLLSQIVFWFLPGKNGATKLSVERDGRLWLAKQREEWWDECCIRPKQFDRCVAQLEAAGFITTAVYKFDGFATKHISLNWESLIAAVVAGGKRGIPQQGKGVLLNREDLGYSSTGKSGIPQQGIPLTEITTETTAEITAEINPTQQDKPVEDSFALVLFEGVLPSKYEQFRELLFRYYRHLNPGVTRVPFDAKDATALSRFIKRHDDLDAKGFHRCLYHKSLSLNNKPSEDIYRWLPRLRDYHAAPQNEFNKHELPGGRKYAEQRTNLEQTRENLNNLRSRQAASRNHSGLAGGVRPVVESSSQRGTG